MDQYSLQYCGLGKVLLICLADVLTNTFILDDVLFQRLEDKSILFDWTFWKQTRHTFYSAKMLHFIKLLVFIIVKKVLRNI